MGVLDTDVSRNMHRIIPLAADCTAEAVEERAGLHASLRSTDSGNEKQLKVFAMKRRGCIRPFTKMDETTRKGRRKKPGSLGLQIHSPFLKSLLE
jgi:hypothetical protein